uniref:Threonine synthase n=1 Tax=Vannella robusta TaxID=1487602 RepID=A0A7S4MDZ6_9EUKA
MFMEEIPKHDLENIIEQAITFPVCTSHFVGNETLRFDSSSDYAKVSWANDSIHILELFHGPTYTFKDIGMQFLGRLMGYLLDQQEKQEKISILVATSGDTGSAAIHAVENHPLIELFVLYPGNGRISNLQERQMATNTSDNIHCIRFDGCSDDVDVVVSRLFQTESLKPFRLTTLNSVNIGRILMQTVHFIFSYVQCFATKILQSAKDGKPLPPVRFCIPTGGLGNGSSCYLAKCMGLPVERIIMAVNENDTISRTLATGTFKMEDVKVTNAPAMDICNPYNIERLLYLMSNRNAELVQSFIKNQSLPAGAKLDNKVFESLKNQFSSYSADQSEVCSTIKNIHKQWNEIIDPHTAVAVCVAKKLPESDNSDTPLICVATAHPAKFPETIENITGEPYTLPEPLQCLLEKQLHVTDMELDTMEDSVAEMIRQFYPRQ